MDQNYKIIGSIRHAYGLSVVREENTSDGVNC